MKMRKPPKGNVWCHIDRLDRKDGKVWAVQSDRGYEVFQAVMVMSDGYTQFFGATGQQPKAVIEFRDARVDVRGGIARICPKS